MIRLAVRVRGEHAEVVLAELLELAPSGVEEVSLDGGVVEFAVYGAEGELPALPDLEAVAGGALVEVSSESIAEDWADRWRRFHRPLVLGDRLTVRPPWSPPAGTGLEVVIDPGRAFGTGAHPTTQMCLELLLGVEPDGGFVDLGCGSGVLAITAAKLGFRPVLALDNDPAAVEAARTNALANGVELIVRRWDLRCEPVPGADTVAANLLGPLLRRLAGGVHDAPALPRRLIAGGLLTTEAAGIAAAFTAAGLREVSRLARGEWAAILFAADGSRPAAGPPAADGSPPAPGTPAADGSPPAPGTPADLPVGAGREHGDAVEVVDRGGGHADSWPGARYREPA